MTTTMHDPQPRVETPTLEDRPSTSGICTTCGFWPCQCADLAWANALTDPDDEILAATRTDMLTTYGQLVLGTELDNAGLDAISDMVDVGLIRPEELTVPTTAAQLLTTTTAWIGQDIETEDDQDGYEPEDLTRAPAVSGPPCCGRSMSPASPGSWTCSECGATVMPRAEVDVPLSPHCDWHMCPMCGEAVMDGSACGRCGY